MIQPAADGQSIYADGMMAAEILRKEDPDAFTILSTIPRKYHSIDADTGWYLEATGPIIQVNNEDVITQIRHNDLDRLPDLVPENKKLDDAHRKWDSILNRDSIRLIMHLQPGDTMVVANQRCLHGRYSFKQDAKSSRTVSGCYVSQDELNSRFR
eukprot:CAMPEP_0194178282 /NCGR_PEP_ID=MMETSP0154-20130528/11917_1 /TAXON_ID=1049557 /ORGANISM="Thalassiothrix antarctica, Strain L6-D1" /LENGTH=154 /DNA_ID=CAMNT_0038893181 /DNA_START=29 /DNA_END=490 /DNA_ORIENTATION=+